MYELGLGKGKGAYKTKVIGGQDMAESLRMPPPRSES